MIPIRTLFLLENDTTIVLEIKRLDLPDTADKSSVYHWLYYQKESKQVIPLVFRSMSSTDTGIQIREFADAHLEFNDSEGVITFNNVSTALSRVEVETFLYPADLSEAIDSYLRLSISF